MTTFLVVMLIYLLLETGSVLSIKPDQPREPLSAGVLLLVAAVNFGMALWAIRLLIEHLGQAA